MREIRCAQEIRAAVIGYGATFNMGRHHLREMERAGFHPTAVVDTNPERLAAAREDFPGIETYSSVQEMLRKSAANLAAIVTPHNTHTRLALSCLRAGRHVVCEKPFAIRTVECDRMIREARKRGLMITVYHNRHWDGCILKAVSEIRAGRIGEVYRVEAHVGCWGAPRDWWRSSRSQSGGLLYDWGAHLVEYVFQVVDAEVVEVAGFAREGVWATSSPWKADTNEDESCAVVRFRNGVWLILTVTQLGANPSGGIVQFKGTKGTYIMDGNQYEIVSPSLGGEVVRVTGRNPESEGWRFYENVKEHLVNGKPLIIAPEYARRIVHVLELVQRSARKGRALPPRYG